MKKKSLMMAALVAACTMACNNEQPAGENQNLPENGEIDVAADNTLTKDEEAQGWELLFDGKTANEFRGVYQDSFPGGGWKVENGELIVMKADGGESTNGGDIVTKRQFKDFELTVDFKLTEGANSGIKYYVVEMMPKPQGSAIGTEFQLLDDEKHPDAKKGRDGNRTIGSLYDLLTADSSKKVNPIGEWNTARIVSKGGHVEHWLNGAKILEYERGSEAFRGVVEISKYKTIMADNGYTGKYPPFGEAPQGHILLQDHGDRVHFKNIKIKSL